MGSIKGAKWRRDITCEMLKELYINQRKTEYYIAKKFGCSQPTIHKKLVDCTIQRRSHIEAAPLGPRIPPTETPEEREKLLKEWKAKQEAKKKADNQRRMKKAKTWLDEIYMTYPNNCDVCTKSISGKSKVLHEIHGKKHPYGTNMSKAIYILNHQKDFIAVCPRCHTTIHGCEDVLGLNLPQVRSLAKKARANMKATVGP